MNNEMYEAFFGFRDRPFDSTPNPRYLVLTDGHREAISSIEYGIASRKGITMLVGEAGVGKTTVIRTAIERQPAPVHCVHLCNPALTRVEFVEMLAARFDLSERAARSKTALLIELEALLRRRHASQETTVLVVDEGQTLPLTLLEEIRLLANIENDDEKLLSVILVGQPRLAERLEHPSVEQLKQRVALWCELPPLTLEETAAYVLTRIRCAGGIAAEIFTRDAVTLLHRAAKGIPRVINVIADNALVTGLAAGQRPIGREIINQVCSDFRIRQQLDWAAASSGDQASTPPSRRVDEAPAPAKVEFRSKRGLGSEPLSTDDELVSVDRRSVWTQPSIFARLSGRRFL
jgi:general secretion pathway protein A